MWRHFRRTLNFQSSFKPAFLLALAIFLLSQSAYADVCVWRNPERTMSKIFQDAGDYKTITKIISDEKRKAIEKNLGEKLTPGESKDWMYYEITGSRGETQGYITADAEKGEYGVIEIVIGITPDGRVKGLYVQRSQERDKTFKSKEFLDGFIGMGIDEVEKSKKAESVASQAVMFGVKKMLLFYQTLGQEK